MGVICLLFEVVNVKAKLAFSSDWSTFSSRYHFFAYGGGGSFVVIGGTDGILGIMSSNRFDSDEFWMGNIKGIYMTLLTNCTYDIF